MPNWCNNEVSFSGDEKNLEKLMILIGTAEVPIQFEKILPVPDCLDDSCRLDWTRAHWGCKWEAVDIYEEGDWVFSFDTPWCPPEGIHRRIIRIIEEYELEIYVTWFYNEPGCQIAGYL